MKERKNNITVPFLLILSVDPSNNKQSSADAKEFNLVDKVKIQYSVRYTIQTYALVICNPVPQPPGQGRG